MRRERPGVRGVPAASGRPRAPGVWLTVRGQFAAFREGQADWGEVAYAVDDGRGERPLPGVQWADWDSAGRLLVATTTGQLEIRQEPFEDASVDSRIDLSGLHPDPQAPPSEARRW